MKSFSSILLLAALAGAGGACLHPEAHAAEAPHHGAEAPLRFAATTVTARDVESTRSYVCQLRAIQHIEVRALETGYLRDVLVDEGQQVEPGRSLFQLQPVLFEAEVARRAADVQHAQVELQNTRILRAGNVVAPAELALAQATLDRANAERSVARAHLHFSRIEAPFAGIVGRLRVRHGSLVQEGDLLTELSDTSQLWVYFNVGEREYLALRQAHRAGEHVTVRLRMANDEVFAHPGVVQTVEADFDNATGTIAFRAAFPNPEGLLRHGETGEVLMTTRHPNALVIPQAATYTELDHTFVYVLDEDDRVHAREITVGEASPHQYVVLRGLQAGERILLDGLRRVHDGEHLAPQLRPLDEVLAELQHIPAE